MPYTQIQNDIANLIDRARLNQEEGLPINSKTTAQNIISYMQDEDLLSKTKVIKLSEQGYGKTDVSY
jgi:hypothetical protein